MIVAAVVVVVAVLLCGMYHLWQYRYGNNKELACSSIPLAVDSSYFIYEIWWLYLLVPA